MGRLTNGDQRLSKPPGWATWLLNRFSPPGLEDELQGDLLEMYAYWVKTIGVRAARWRFGLAVLQLIRPFTRSTTKQVNYYSQLERRPPERRTTSSFHPAMILNYLKIATRNLRKDTSFTIINSLGLALGMLCCLFILLWVQDEKGMDNFHTNGPNLYTAYQTISANGNLTGNYGTPMRQAKSDQPYLDFLVENAARAIPDIKHVVFYATGYELPWGHPETFQVGDTKIKLEGARAGQDFFNVFTYPLIVGSAETALKDIDGIAISRKMAKLFFGSPQQAMGKTMRFENRMDVRVAAVFENLPANSSHKFDYLFNWDAQKKKLEWASGDFRTYLQLLPTANVSQVETKINRFIQPRLATDKGFQTQIGLQPYGDQYLRSHFVNGKPTNGRIEYVQLFSGVALFILLIGCINFMILATARSAKRAKEVGVRKVLGSTRAHLIGQFYSEAWLLAGLAMIVTILLTLILLPTFNAFASKQIPSPIFQGWFWASLMSLTLITGLLAGSYPALFLSSLEPVRVLKGILRFSGRAIWFRQGLTVFQFGLSVLLLVATIVISRQTRYVQNTHLGYDRDNLIYVRVEGELTNKNKYLFFKEQASRLPGVAMVDRSSEAPHDMGFVVDAKDGVAETATGEDAINWEGKAKNASVGFKPTSVGFDFTTLMNLKLVEGRSFSRANATDSTDAFLVNQEAVRQMGLKNPVGKWISAWQKKGHIIGVLKDYHTNSLHDPIKPLIVDIKEGETFGVLMIRMRPGQTKQALVGLEQLYKAINPNYPFAYQFVDQEYAKLYRSEQVMAKLVNVFAFLAIIISSLGLLGLVMFSTQQRTKEIGIRKVLGASVAGIITLLSRDFLRLVFMAIMIASPLAWYVMHQWLEGFAYRIDIDWWIFALAGLLAVGIALLTVSYQSIKAALVNPVKSLRSE